MRCFIAIELPEAIRRSLAALQTRFNVLDRAIRWTRPDHVHLTLKFLGDVPDAQVLDVCSTARAAAERLPPIALEVRGAGCFPPHGAARVIWAGVSGPPAELVNCYSICEQALAELGFAPEARAFRPHLTIGRARDPHGARDVRATLEQLKDFVGGSFIATELVVFQSVLSREGSTYTRLARAPFSGQ